MSETKNVTELSAKELAALLKEKKKKEKAAQEKKKARYEERRNEMVNTLGGFALSLSNQMRDLKVEAFTELLAFKELMLEYGTLRRGQNNKGSFEVKTDKFKVEFANQINKRFDERAQLAEAKLRQFMDTFIKKRDVKVYNLIKTLLEKNPKTGDYDIDLINRLYKMEAEFDDPNWLEAIRLFKESYTPSHTAQYVKFSLRDETSNTWVPIILDFAKLSTANALPTNDEKAA